MTNYERHVIRWEYCDRCVLRKHRKRVVLAGGIVPAPILFVGEAPGASEDVIGRPFVGPAGKLLHRVIDSALDGQYDYALTNLVACIPKDASGSKAGEPPKASIRACASRLRDFTGLCEPRLIVRVGKLATKWVEDIFIYHDGSQIKDCHYADIIHPAAILRMDVSQRGLAIQRSIVVLENAVIAMEEQKEKTDAD